MMSPMQSTVRPEMVFARASKSRIGVGMFIGPRILGPILGALTEAVGPVEIVPDIGLHRILERRETAVIAGAVESIDLALGEILIAAADLLGHVDIVDIRPGAERSISRQHQIPEAARLA